MKKAILLAILLAVGWKGYEKYRRELSEPEPRPEYVLGTQADSQTVPDIDTRAARLPAFACDGRTYCSQMNSCDEAKYFLEHCPGTKMDGDHDGVPCEQQWCG